LSGSAFVVYGWIDVDLFDGPRFSYSWNACKAKQLTSKGKGPGASTDLGGFQSGPGKVRYLVVRLKMDE